MKIIVTIVLFITGFYPAFSQITISGVVMDENKQGLPGANVYLAGTYDGAATNTEGKFLFQSKESGERELIITSVGYEKMVVPIQLQNSDVWKEIALKPKTGVIDEVVITAGAFETNDKGKSVVMKPMDIVTTAGATADIASVMNTLPGTQTVAEDGRLYVRGGDSREINVFIDGVNVPEAFGPAPSNVPSRFRFSPFLFKGTYFSTGGYSAEYGQALSSVLVLETGDLSQRSQTDISVMSVGADINQTIKWEKSSVYTQIQYTDLGLYFKAVPQKYEYEKAPRGVSGIFHFKSDLNEKGLLKFYSNYQSSDLKILQPYFPDVTKNEWVDLETDYFYNSLTADYQINDRLLIKGGISGAVNKEKNEIGPYQSDHDDYYFHGKLMIDFSLSKDVFVKAGMENYHSSLNRKAGFNESLLSDDISQNLISGFVESDIHFTPDLLLRAGLRFDQSDYLHEGKLAPRLSLAYKMSKKSQLSTAYGHFYQNPQNDFLYLSNELEFTGAEHFILNYQYKSKGRIFRAEAYHKSYNDLIKYEQNDIQSYSYLNNSGDGYANGVDLFWRDEKSFENVDYWVSYSFINSEKNIENYPESSTPTYISGHNFSFVYKHFIPAIRTQLGWTYHFSSSRNYNDPNTDIFMDGEIPAYHDLSVNLSYLIKQNIILHGSVSNVLGLERSFGRQFSVVPDSENHFSSIPVDQNAKHFVFLGCFITLSKDKSANQLNNL